jgi:arylsulfatase A
MRIKQMKMIPSTFLRWLFIVGILLSGCLLQSSQSTPNIVVYLANDLGYGSINLYGADQALVSTPNLNKLAKEGVRFTRGFTTGSVCSPTRYGLLTGRYSWRTRLKKGVINSNDGMLIDAYTETIASWLREYGYHSAAIGKWHLGYLSSRFKNLLGKISPGPLDVGFDYHFGGPNNMDDLHKIYIENDQIYGLRSDKISKYGRSFYGKPYVGYDAPQRVTTKVMDTLTEKAVRWIDSLGEDQPFFLYFGSVAVHHPISPSERMRGTSNAGAYGDFIHDVDHSVGQIMEALDVRGLSDNTLFIFTSDNGGDIPTDPDRPEVQAQEAGLAANGSHRGDKHTIFNGGFAVPFVVRWPGNHEAGITSVGLVNTADIFATVAEAVSGKIPSPTKAAPDSFSFLPLLKPVSDWRLA